MNYHEGLTALEQFSSKYEKSLFKNPQVLLGEYNNILSPFCKSDDLLPNPFAFVLHYFDKRGINSSDLLIHNIELKISGLMKKWVLQAKPVKFFCKFVNGIVEKAALHGFKEAFQLEYHSFSFHFDDGYGYFMLGCMLYW